MSGLRGLIARVALLALVCAAPTQAQDAPREVNVTQGSDPGWIPSEELEAEAMATWERYYALVATEDFAAAHAMLTEGFKAQYPLSTFEQDRIAAKATRGTLLSRNVTTVTWTKGGSAAPAPGIYVAIDATAQFENVDRFCGYTILYRAPDAEGFEVMRFEEVLLDNAAFDSIAKQNSELQALLVWRLVARSCPNYRLPPLPDTLGANIEFDTPASAKEAIMSRDGIETRMENGWTIVADSANLTIWSFAPEGEPTYPAVIKRWVVATGPQSSRAHMDILCGAEKPQCDALFDEMAYRNGFTPVSIEQGQ